MSTDPDTNPNANNEQLIVGQYQAEPSPLDKTATLAQLSNVAAQAEQWGVQLLVLPEMYMTGYNLTKDELNNVAETSDGALFEAVAKLCQQHQMAVFYGYGERTSDGALYNSAQLIDKEGISVLNYRKTHLWGELDRNLFSAGDALSPVVSVCGWQVGAAICYDIEFPETLRHLAIQGAEVAIVPTGLMSPYSEVAEKVVPVRAYENRMFVAYTNYCGAERDLHYVGCSSIADPNGLVLASAASESVLLTATLKRSALQEARASLPYLIERRPELYNTLS